MTINSIMVGKGGKAVMVGDEGEIAVVIHPHPPKNEVDIALPFSQFFTDDGTSSGSEDMRVNGSTNSVTFSINAINDFDLYIKTVSIIISDNNAALDKFGAITALTNGVRFEYSSAATGTIPISAPITTNLDMVRTGAGSPPFGNTTNAFRADVSGGGADSYLPVIDMNQTYGLTYGLRLRKDTNDKIQFTIQDNITGIDKFNAIGFGIKF